MSGATEKPYPFTNEHPALRIPGWAGLLGAGGKISPAEAVRHFLITGETGSGKSRSAVIPLLTGVLRYPEPDCYREYKAKAKGKPEGAEQLRPAALVVDPKQELLDVVNQEAAGRKVTTLRYGTPGHTLYFFEGKDTSELNAVDAVSTIVAQSDCYSRDMATTREPIWSIQAANTIKDFVAIDMYLARQGMEKMTEFWGRISSRLTQYNEYAAIAPCLAYNRANYFKPIASLIAVASREDSSYPLSIYIDECHQMHVPGDLTATLITLVTLAPNTRSSVLWVANGILADIASEEFAACVSLNPIEPPENSFSVREMLDRGDVLVYIPTISPSAIADTIGRCIKAKFLEFVFTRANKVRPFAYIVDEAHRFITAGEQEGEQSLLDRCRAYRTLVVLATQSIASMKVRLDASGNSGSAALQVMLNNCGNALYFRSPDITTQENVQARIPDCPISSRPHVIKVRPLTSLATGGCYALRANGTWGLFQVQLEG
jgi:hypothetical protein